MFEQHLTPKDFGIKVRDYCDELQITANNNADRVRIVDDGILLWKYL